MGCSCLPSARLVVFWPVSSQWMKQQVMGAWWGAGLGVSPKQDLGSAPEHQIWGQQTGRGCSGR